MVPQSARWYAIVGFLLSRIMDLQCPTETWTTKVNSGPKLPCLTEIGITCALQRKDSGKSYLELEAIVLCPPLPSESARSHCSLICSIFISSSGSHFIGSCFAAFIPGFPHPVLHPSVHCVEMWVWRERMVKAGLEQLWNFPIVAYSLHA